MNEQGDIFEYYEPLETSLKRFSEALSDDPVAAACLEDALSTAVGQRLRAAEGQSEERFFTANSQRSIQIGVPSISQTRSIFDDVDE